MAHVTSILLCHEDLTADEVYLLEQLLATPRPVEEVQEDRKILARVKNYLGCFPPATANKWFSIAKLMWAHRDRYFYMRNLLSILQYLNDPENCLVVFV
jgi:hypothetical protein